MATPANKARRLSMGSPGSNTGMGDSGLAVAAARRLAPATPDRAPIVRPSNRVNAVGANNPKRGVKLDNPVGSLPEPASNKDLKTRYQRAARKRMARSGY